MAASRRRRAHGQYYHQYWRVFSFRNVGRWHDARQTDLPGMGVVRGFVVLPRRWVIERTNGWTDLCRRLQRDHDRRLDVSTAWVWFAHVRLLLHRVAGAGAGAEAVAA